MKDHRDKHELEYVRGALRRWDPIGVLPGPGDDQGPMDEYDAYAPHVLGLLQGGADAIALERHLGEMRNRSMGDAQPRPASDRPAAEDIVAWWRSRSRL